MKKSFNKVAVLVSPESWFVTHAKELTNELQERGYVAALFGDHSEIGDDFEVVFALSYFKKISAEFLKQRKHTLVVHGSNLPKGRGWTPIFWQILLGKNVIPIVLFEVNEDIDSGDIYLKDEILLEGHELYDEVREKQAEKQIEMCLRFLSEYDCLKPIKQEGKGTYFAKRSPKDSRLDVNKTIAEQFNLLRVVNNEAFPAFFDHKGHKYRMNIFKEETRREKNVKQANNTGGRNC